MATADSQVYANSTLESQLAWWKQVAVQMSKGTWVDGVRQTYFQDLLNADLVWLQEFSDQYAFIKLERAGEEPQRIRTIKKELQAEDN